MSTVTSLKFAVSSSWDGSGIDEAKAAITQLKAQIESMSDSRLGLQVQLEGAEEAQAKVEEISRTRDTMIKVKADADEAQAKINEAAQNHESLIRARADADEAQAKIMEVARDREATIEVHEEGAAEAAGVIEAAKRTASRSITFRVDADTSGAEGSFSKLGGLLSNHLILVGALTAALTAMGAVAAMVGGALLTALGGGVIVAGIAITTMFSKMQQQAQDTINMQKAQADTADNQVATAYQNVTQVATQGAQQIVAAQEQVRNAQQSVADTAEQGARSIKSANDQAVLANQEVIQSQRDVADAYRNAQRSLEDLQMQQSESGDNITAAELGVERAQQRVNEGPQQGDKNPALTQRENLNALALAQDHYRETVLKAQQTNEDYTKAQAQGVDGSDKVVQAKQKEANAVKNAADAQTNVQTAIKTAAENNQKAQQQLSDAVTKLSQTQQTAAENNTKAQQELQNALIGQADAHRQLDAAMAKSTNAVMQFMKQLNGIVAPIQGPLKAALASLELQLTEMTPVLHDLFANAGTLVQPFTDTITGAVKGALPGMSNALLEMGQMMPGLKDGMAQLGTSVGTMFDTLGKDSANLGKIADDFGHNFGSFLNIWSDFVVKTGPDAANTLNHLGQGINAMTQGTLNGIAGFEHNAAPAPGHMGIIQSTATGVGTIAQQALPGVGTAVHAAGSAFAPAVQSLSKPIGDMVNSLGGGAGKAIDSFAPGLDKLADALGKIVTALQPAIPLLAAFAQGMGGAFTTELQLLTPLIVKLADGIGSLLQHMGPLSGVIVAAGAAFMIYKTVMMGVTAAVKAYEIAVIAVQAAQKAWMAIQGMMSIVMATNPIMLVVIALAALVAGIVYLATKTQFFQDAWRDTWNAVKVAASAVWNFLKEAFTEVTSFLGSKWGWLLALFFPPIGALVALGAHWKEVWGAIQLVAQVVWNWIKDTWSDTINSIKQLWDDISQPIQLAWSTSWNWVKDTAEAIWNWLHDRWNDFVTGVRVIWDAWWSLFATAWQAGWNTIKQVGVDIWNSISGAFKSIWDDLRKGFDGFVQLVKGIWDGLKKVFAEPINFIIRASNDTIGKVISSAHMDEIKLADGGSPGDYGVQQGMGGSRADNLIRYAVSPHEYVINGLSASQPGMKEHLDGINFGNTQAPKPNSSINNFAPMGVQGFADGGQVKGPNGQPSSEDAINRALSWVPNGREYNADGWLDCSGLASGVYDTLRGIAPHREFTTVSNFEGLGFKSGTGGAFEIGVLPQPGDEGHMAMTLGGHNIESAGGGKGIQIDGSAWGADNPYFTDHYYLPGDLFSPQYFGKGWAGSSGGSGGFLGMIGNAFSGAVHALRGGAADAFIAATNPILAGIPDPFLGTNKPFGSYPKGLATNSRNDLANLIRGHESGSSASSGAGFGTAIPSPEHKALIDQAVMLAGGPAPNTLEQWESGLETLVQRESSWNPGAVNNWDSNAAAGHPSKGLAQMIDSSFAAHMVPGHGNIFNPLDNLASDVGYIKATYGGITNVQQANAGMSPHGYATGTQNAQPGWALVGEKGPELVNFTGGEQVLNNPDTMKQMQQYMSQGAQGIAQNSQQSWTSALTSPLDQFGQDIGLGSITSGSGVISKLFSQGISYGQQLATWTPPAGSLLGSLTKGAPNPLSGLQYQAPGTGVLPGNDAQLDNPPSAAQAQAQANAATAQQNKQLNGQAQPAAKQLQPMVGGDLHIHASSGNPVKEWEERVGLHVQGFDPFGQL